MVITKEELQGYTGVEFESGKGESPSRVCPNFFPKLIKNLRKNSYYYYNNLCFGMQVNRDSSASDIDAFFPSCYNKIHEI